jgi:hypothetical protein
MMDRVDIRLRATGALFAGCAIVCIAIAPGFLTAQDSAAQADDYQLRFREGQLKLGILGAGSCAKCHRPQAGYFHKNTTQSLSEYEDWLGRDEQGRPNQSGVHARTYQKTLQSERSRIMAELLSKYDKLGDDPTERKDCLACHAFGSDGDRRAADYQISDGVSCEACHGKAVNWEGEHRFPDWHDKPAAEWLAKGMYDTRSLLRWAEKCAECHVSSSEHRRVSHAMMGAGHPDLSFELASDSFDVPKHWRDERTQLPGEGSWYYVRLWAVGQAVAMREAMKTLAEAESATPDFALLDCYACHHEFLRTTSRLPTRGRIERPGEPTWNEAPFILARHAAGAIDPSSADAIKRELDVLRASISIHHADWQKIHSAARSIAEMANRLAHTADTKQFDLVATRRLLQTITGDAESIFRAGPLAADHAYRALRILYKKAWAESPQRPANHALIVAQIDRLNTLIYPPADPKGSHKANNSPVLNSLDPVAFCDAMKQLHDAFDESATTEAAR